MRTFGIRISLAAALCVVTAFRFVSVAIERTFALIPHLFDPRPLRELFEAPRLTLSVPGGDQVDGALFTRNRHEAGLARLGAVRHI